MGGLGGAAYAIVGLRPTHGRDARATEAAGEVGRGRRESALLYAMTTTANLPKRPSGRRGREGGDGSGFAEP